MQAQLDQRYSAIERALKSGDPEALAALTADPQMPDALKQPLGAIPPQALHGPEAVDGILQQIKAGMEQQKPALIKQTCERVLGETIWRLETEYAAAREQGPFADIAD